MENDDDVIVGQVFESAIDLRAATRRTFDDFRACDSCELDRAVAAPAIAHQHSLNPGGFCRTDRTADEILFVERRDDRYEWTHQPDGTIRVVRGYVLAGGDSRRMGSPKADLLLGERTFLQRVASALSAVVDKVTIVARVHDERDLGWPLIVEQKHDTSAAIYGVEAALLDAREDDAFIVAVDYALLTADAVRYLAERHQSGFFTVPVWGGIPQVLCAIYPPALLHVVSAKILAGRFEMRPLLEAGPSNTIHESDIRKVIPGEPFLNVNTPANHAEARKIYESAHAHRPEG